MPTRVRVGVVAFECADALRDCLAALPAALEGLDAEVVVVDNASTDGSADVAEAAGATVVRADRNEGYARGMNRALAGTDAPVLVALNPDTVPPPGSLARLVAELEGRPDVALVAPRLVHPDGRVQHSVHRFPSLGLALVANLVPATWVPRRVRDRLWLPGAVRPDRSGPCPWATGAVHVLRAAALPDPPYRERWFMYVEDVDLCARLAEAGWGRWFAADVAVVHVGGVSGQVAFGGRAAHRWWSETYEWYGGRHGGMALRAYAAVNALGMVLRGAWGLARRHVAVVVRGRPAPLPPPAEGTGPDRRPA